VGAELSASARPRTNTSRRWGEFASFVAGLALLVSAVGQIDRAVNTRFPADLVVDHRAARAFWDGYSPFSPEGARRAGVAEFGATGIGHPPTTSFLFLPFARLELQTVRKLLAWASLATLLAELAVAAVLLGWSAGVATLVAGLIASAPFFIYMVTLGQVSQLIAFAFFLAWWASRKGRAGLAGAALGVACTLKLFPGVMVLWLAITRRWRAVAAAVAVYLVAAVVMTARFGLESWRVFFVAQKEVANAWVANVANQSLHGVAQRLWSSPACELPGRVAPEALALSTLVSLALLVFAAHQARRLEDGTPRTLDLSFAAFAVLSVLTSQWAWPHYNVLLVLPAMVVATGLRDAAPALRAAGAVVLAGLLLSWRLDIRAATVLQIALWRGDRGAHLPLHLVEVLSWLPGVLLLAVVLVLTVRLRQQHAC
jgi:alpha-1,2-mannosyltransferase